MNFWIWNSRDLEFKYRFLKLSIFLFLFFLLIYLNYSYSFLVNFMAYDEKTLLKHINRIRMEIGHEEVDIDIHEIIYDKEKNELWIITDDRPDKSAVIGKGGWVVGRLREELEINSIHVESFSDFLLKKYRMELSNRRLESFINECGLDDDYLLALNNLKTLLELKLKDLYAFDFKNYFKDSKSDADEENSNELNFEEARKPVAVVATSGGTDSSFSLILAKKLGFNPISITVDPGTIVLPKQFKYNIDKLCEKLEVRHEYISVDYSDLIADAFTGRFHPCGRCSKIIEETLYKYALDNDIKIVIFGDMLATGSQCITEQSLESDSGKTLFRLNLPAALSVSKLENKSLTSDYDLNKIQGFGCPLLYEVHSKFPYMKKYSIQRILRETRSGALEPGEALDLIWSFYKTK